MKKGKKLKKSMRKVYQTAQEGVGQEKPGAGRVGWTLLDLHGRVSTFVKRG